MKKVTEDQIIKKITKPKSKTQMILEALQRGERLSPLDIWLRWKIYRASDVIFKLRRRGYDIATQMTKGPEGVEYAIYSLNQQAA